jgi:hypothetical protein
LEHYMPLLAALESVTSPPNTPTPDTATTTAATTATTTATITAKLDWEVPLLRTYEAYFAKSLSTSFIFKYYYIAVGLVLLVALVYILIVTGIYWYHRYSTLYCDYDRWKAEATAVHDEVDEDRDLEGQEYTALNAFQISGHAQKKKKWIGQERYDSFATRC